jgi:hypothetical protein
MEHGCCPPSLLLADRLHRTARAGVGGSLGRGPPNRPLTPLAHGLFSPRFRCEAFRLAALCGGLPPWRPNVSACTRIGSASSTLFTMAAVGEYRRCRARPKSGPATHPISSGQGPHGIGSSCSLQGRLPFSPGTDYPLNPRARASSRSSKGLQSLIPTRVTLGLCHTSMSVPGPVCESQPLL